MTASIVSLPKLTELLRDPDSGPELVLCEHDLAAVVKYDGVEDFAEVYCEFLDAVKSNSTITEIHFGALSESVDKPRMFPIINTLCKHLPKADTIEFSIPSEEEVATTADASIICKEIPNFRTVHISGDYLDPGVRRPDFDLNPDLEVFRYHTPYNAPNNVVFGHFLLSLPMPSKLRELSLTSTSYEEWHSDANVARGFTDPEFSRLVEVMQVSSLMKLKLQDIRIETEDKCRQFARALVASLAKDLSLHFFTPDPGNYRSIVSALSRMPHLESLEAIFALDDWNTDKTIESFSISAGDIVRGAPEMKSLKIAQGWKPWDDVQCRDLAMAIQTPSCALSVLDISIDQSETVISGAATIMSTFSAPSSSVEQFAVQMVYKEEEEVESWLSMLPRKTVLRSLAIETVSNSLTAMPELQQDMFLSIVSRWFYLEHCKGAFVSSLIQGHRQLQLDILTRLNKAGRHYLTSPTISKADGIEVLVKVRNELDDIYTHLLENPCLCDRALPDPSSKMVSPMRKKPRLSSCDST